MGIWPAGSHDQSGDDYFRLSPKGVGTGPGVFDEWKSDDFISLVRNPNYWQKGKPAWERLVPRRLSSGRPGRPYGLVEASAIPDPASGWWFDAEADEWRAYDLDKARSYLKQSQYLKARVLN